MKLVSSVVRERLIAVELMTLGATGGTPHVEDDGPTATIQIRPIAVLRTPLGWTSTFS